MIYTINANKYYIHLFIELCKIVSIYIITINIIIIISIIIIDLFLFK